MRGSHNCDDLGRGTKTPVRVLIVVHDMLVSAIWRDFCCGRTFRAFIKTASYHFLKGLS